MTVTTTRPPRQRRPVDPPISSIPIGHLQWMRYAACDGISTDIFFPDLDELPSADAQLLCSRCPVRELCLQWALEHDEDGYWGGTTKTQREAIMSGRHRVKCPNCAGRDVVELGRDTVCLGCGLSW